MMSDQTKKGLFGNEVLKLREKHGYNEIEKRKNFSTISLLASQYRNVITLVLLFAIVFSLLVKEFIDAGFILFVLLGNGLFGFIQEYRAQNTLEKLNKLVLPVARVIRESRKKEINAREIVPNDIVVLAEGDRIPADGIILSDIKLEVDESILTGESLPVGKKKGDWVFSGTYVVQGKADVEVQNTGMDTKIGEIARELKVAEKPKIPLSESLNRLAKNIALGAGLLSIILIPLGILQGRDLKELALTATSLAVAIIPEGLPLVVTIALAVGAYQMVKRKTIVRKIASIETLGSTSVILTDKTGTITQNKMSVKSYYIPNKKNEDLLIRAAILGNTASFAFGEAQKEPAVLGDKTDAALLLFAQQKKNDIDEFKRKGKIIEEKPFDPVRKTIEVVWQENDTSYTFIRGAPETILKLTNSKDKEVKKKIDTYAKESLRVIGFAYKKNGDRAFSFLGLVGIYDPPRKEAKKAILEAKGAGINIVMVTGDNPITAMSIAEETGMIGKGELVLTSEDIAKMSDSELAARIAKVRVFARMLPKDKLRLVRLYKENGYIAAVTGDGVNDALALSEAHIGIAMGTTGTDVAKEASDMIITDDNLYTIVHAIEEGRRIFNNIIKVVVFLLATNMMEFFVIVFGFIFNFPIALSATQILWVNLVSDGLPALALATDLNKKDVLKNKPRDIKEAVLNTNRIKAILKITIPFSIFLVAIYVFSLGIFSHETARMIIFNALVGGVMLVAFIVRGGIFPINKFLLFTIFLSLLLQLVITLNPLLRGIFL